MTTVDAERVLVVPTRLLHELGHFQGFTDDVYRYLEPLLSPDNTRYLPRREMEQDPGYKQLIPYVIFRHTDAGGRVSLFNYTRGTGQGESRLHRKRSIGIGGHICADDASEDNAYEEGRRRELAEEVRIETECREVCVGLINDDLTDVGRVHLGVVHLVDVQTTDVTPREADIAEAGFVPIEQLLSDADHFESWSQICLDALFRPAGQPPA